MNGIPPPGELHYGESLLEKLFKRIRNPFKADYNRGMGYDKPAIKPPKKTNLKAINSKPPPPPPCYPPPRLDPISRREGRPRRIYKGRETSDTFEYPICSTGNSNTSVVPYVLYDQILKELQDPMIQKLVGDKFVELQKNMKERF